MSWNKKKIVQLEHDLYNYKNMMEIQLFPRIWYVPSNLNCWVIKHLWRDDSSRAEATELQQRRGFETFSADMQSFVPRIAAGHTEIENILRLHNDAANDWSCHTTSKTPRGSMERVEREVVIEELLQAGLGWISVWSLGLRLARCLGACETWV